jgi:CDP-diacylglycerol--glycerol-3-phosphate 3-phosphatidyltransferase
MISKLIGRLFSWLRDGLARGLLGIGLRPNALTVLSMFLMIGAGVAIALGEDYWRPVAATLLFLAGAGDLLDGAVAKLGRLESRFGGILDSVCDRASDAALYFGMALYFAFLPDAGPLAAAKPNLTLVVLARAGLVWAYLISYIKARAETAGAQGHGGFWQRPERLVTILLGVTFHHVTTAIWILGLWPLATVAHRLWRARWSSRLAESGSPADGDPRGVLRVVLWHWARGTTPFDIHAGAVVLMMIFWSIPATFDPLRELAALWIST